MVVGLPSVVIGLWRAVGRVARWWRAGAGVRIVARCGRCSGLVRRACVGTLVRGRSGVGSRARPRLLRAGQCRLPVHRRLWSADSGRWGRWWVVLWRRWRREIRNRRLESGRRRRVRRERGEARAAEHGRLGRRKRQRWWSDHSWFVLEHGRDGLRRCRRADRRPSRLLEPASTSRRCSTRLGDLRHSNRSEPAPTSTEFGPAAALLRRRICHNGSGGRLGRGGHSDARARAHGEPGSAHLLRELLGFALALFLASAIRLARRALALELGRFERDGSGAVVVVVRIGVLCGIEERQN